MPSIPVPGKFYPPVGFHFAVAFLDFKMAPEISFQSVSGLTVEYEVEKFKEGGENRFEHTLPVRSKYPNLVLKRGLMADSQVIDWCLDALQKRDIRPVTLSVALLNELHVPLKAWTINRAWPVKWVVSDFKADENNIVVETLELNYSHFDILL